MAREHNSLKTGACGDDPKGVICAAGCQGGMKLKIPNPGVSGDESTAPLYACFRRSRTYIKAMRTDARTTTMARVVARATTAVDIVGLIVGRAFSGADSERGGYIVPPKPRCCKDCRCSYRTAATKEG